MIKFNKESSLGYYIQNLLRNTYIPRCLSINPSNKSIVDNPITNTFIENNHFYRYVNGEKKLFIQYKFGEKLPGLTSNFISNQNYYSSETHEALGNYLRAFDDYYQMDLMGMYNCFSNRLLSNVFLPLTASDKGSVYPYQNNREIRDASYIKTTLFPIRVGEKYNIKIFNNINGNIIVQPVFYSKGNLRGISISEDDEKNLVFPSTSYSESNFQYTLSYEEEAKETLLNNQNSLYLIIQVPTMDKELLISAVEQPHYINPINVSLLQTNPGYNRPFSDKLVEYLIGNAITPVDEIHQNIENIQAILISEKFKKEYVENNPTMEELMKNLQIGIFNEPMRRIIYYAFFDKEIPDFTGYIDKDVESLLEAYRG